MRKYWNIFFSHTFLVISSMSGVVSSSFGTTFRDMLPRKQACILDTALVNSVKYWKLKKKNGYCWFIVGYCWFYALLR
jgi:hypothetical protein